MRRRVAIFERIVSIGGVRAICFGLVGNEMGNWPAAVNSIRDLIDSRGTTAGERAFLFAPDDEAQLNYAQLRSAVRSFAHRLRFRHRIAKGAHVGLFLPNGAEFVIGYLGTMYLGAVACPVSYTHLTLPTNREV